MQIVYTDTNNLISRPNAEKLLLHPFFKQAKRKDYLIKTILAELPPLEQRPRKVMPQKQVTITRTDEWDFDDEEEQDLLDSNGDSPMPTTALGQVQENSKKTATPKRHISFGDVVVRSNSIHPSDNIPPAPTSTSGTPPRKSRFVIEESNSRDPTDTYTSSSVRSSSPMLDEEPTHDGEVMKGRFYVNQPNKATVDPSVAIVSTDDDLLGGLHKMPSQDTLNVTDRKSRFEISSTTSPMLYQPVPLSRDSSSYSSSSTNGNRSTAVTEKRYPADTSTLTSENIALLTESSRKIGRFELTGGSACSSVDVTPRGSISSSHMDHMAHAVNHQQSHLSIDSNQPTQHSAQYQIEELLRFNESQRLILQELSVTFAKKDSMEDLHTFVESEHNVAEELSSTVEHLDKLIQQTLKENTQLQKENEALRRELKELKSN